MRGWRWYLIAAGTMTLMFATAHGSVTHGLLVVDVAAVFWAARVHVVQEPRWTIDDELEAVRKWTL